MENPTPEENLKYLQDVVIPFVELMPQNEDNPAAGRACFDLNSYIGIRGLSGNDNAVGTRIYPEAGAISEKYNCGYVGCLAGWYALMSNQDKRLLPDEQRRLDHFNHDLLAEHFGVTSGEIFALFGTRNCGIELVNAVETGVYEDKYDANENMDSDGHSNLDCLHERAVLLDDIINGRPTNVQTDEMDI